VAGFSANTALLTLVLNIAAAAFASAQDTAPAAKSDPPAAVAPAATPSAAAPAPSPASAAPAADAKKQTAPKSSPGNSAPKPQEQPPGWFQFIPFGVMALLFWMLLIRPQQSEQRRRRELMNQLKKNDRVVTNGGLIGTIADLSADGRFVTLKVDDSTRIRFLRSSIHGPLDEKPESPEKK
jgi:preprotein translocase subunit YajC